MLEFFFWQKCNSTFVTYSVNAFIHAVVKLQEETEFYLIDSFQMTARWQGSFKGLNKLTVIKICSYMIAIHTSIHSFIMCVYVFSLTQ